jgi:2-oxoglutarate dehydrogenase E2 component (dihydrolipoamide succinyltransferase)
LDAVEAEARRQETSESGIYNGGSRGFISPVVAKIAGENHIDLARVKGTGLGGRITKKDVLNFIQAAPAAVMKPLPAQPVPLDHAPGDRVVPVSVIRRSIAERMLTSKQTSAHVLTAMEADMSHVAAHMAANKDAFARDGLKLTYTAYFISAIASALRAFPLANSSWSEAGLVIHGAYNIGMATSLGEEGLIVPVIKDADRLSLAGVARAVNDLSARARAKKLQPEEVRGGTFTLTNHGISGSLFAMPIINQPQCGILGTGAIQKRPVVVTDADGNDAIAIRPMVYLSFVFDHRILDGALADMFLSRVVESLQNWH